MARFKGEHNNLFTCVNINFIKSTEIMKNASFQSTNEMWYSYITDDHINHSCIECIYVPVGVVDVVGSVVGVGSVVKAAYVSIQVLSNTTLTCS